MPQSKRRVWESFLRETNLQHAMHNFYWYIIGFYFTSDPFSRPSSEQSERTSTENVSGEKYIRCRYRETVCIERYIGTFLYFFFLLPLALRYSLSLRSRVLCRSDGVGSAAQHRVYREKYFCCALASYECIADWNIYKSVYWNSTNETNSECRLCGLLHVSHRFLLRHTKSGLWP